MLLAALIAAALFVLVVPDVAPAQSVAERWDLVPAERPPGLQFGRSVAVAGDRVVVGAPGDAAHGPKSGAAFVFDRTAGGWAQTKLVPPDGETEARFGWKVGVTGDGRVVVAAPWASNPRAGRSGKLYVYEEADGRWRHRLLRVGDPAVTGQIGRGLAVAGGRIVAGAPYDTTANGPRSGALVVFEEGADGWSSETLVPERGAPDGWFGLVAAADGERVAGGGYHTRQASGPEAGAASVFERAADGSWAEQPLDAIARPARKDHFGRSLALLGPRVFVGAEEDDNANGTDAGGVFVLRPGQAGAGTELLVPAGGAPRSYFGFVVAATDRALAAAAGAEVHLFSGFGAGPPRERRLSTLVGAPLPGAVSALAGDGRRLVVGTGFTDTPAENTGAALVVTLAPERM